jgi:hypothetical protein
VCTAGTCATQPCADGSQNGTETDVDCGGGSTQCPRCNVGQRCVNGGDCGSGSCLGGICSNCFDGLRNGSETDVDCGGACGDCNPGQLCVADGDCNSNACQDGRCCGGRERDCTRCAERLSPGLTCDNANDQGTANGCRTFLQCMRANEICTVRHAPGCSDAPNGVCNHLTYGGNGSTGLSLADNVLGTAQ